MQKFTLSLSLLRDVWYLTQSYWRSEEKKKAFFLLFCIIALTLGIVYMLVLLNQWNNTFYSDLQNYQTDKLFDDLLEFSGLAAVYIIFSVYSYYLQQMLIINWRKWLTQSFLDTWLRNKTYYHLQMFGHATDNPDQRISEDVRLFVEMTLSFSIGLLKALCTFISFVVVLYDLSGPCSFTLFGREWVLEGYLFWAAFIYSIIGTYVTHLVGHKLVQLNFVQQRYEADFRFSMIRMRESSESVAFYQGEQQEGLVFKERFTRLLENFWRLVTKQKQLVWLNSGYSQIAIIFPFVAAMNRYLAKEISLGGLMQVVNAFGSVQGSLSYIVDTYMTLAQWQAVVMRLTSFDQHMREVAKAGEGLGVERSLSSGGLSTEELQINLPDGRPLLEHINLELHPGENVLIKGVSGSGKSTLLRGLAGIWPYVEGRVSLPEQSKLMFIPQKPYLPLGSLRDALLYPGRRQVSDAELVQLLEKCKIGYLKNKLEEVADWSHTLSIGEQQRLAFARVHLQRPEWLFLDEATSALDEETEAELYAALLRELPQTTLVSVGHRSTLRVFHQVLLILDKEKKTATLQRS